MKLVLYLLGFLLIVIMPSSFAQVDVEEIEEMISFQSMMVSIVIGIITAIGIGLTYWISKRSLDNSKQASEVDIILSLSDRLFRSDEGKVIIEKAKDQKKFVESSDENNDDDYLVSHRDVENFLNTVETALILKDRNAINDDLIQHEFEWVFDTVIKHDSITKFIQWKLCTVEKREHVWQKICEEYNIEKPTVWNNE